MIPNAKRGSTFAFAIAAVEAAAMYGRRSTHLLFDVLHGAYDGHMERAQMRLAPIKSRSWRDIPRAGAEVIAAGAEHEPSGTRKRPTGSALPHVSVASNSFTTP